MSRGSIGAVIGMVLGTAAAVGVGYLAWQRGYSGIGTGLLICLVLQCAPTVGGAWLGARKGE